MSFTKTHVQPERLNIETSKEEATVQTGEETTRGKIEASFPPSKDGQ